VPKDGTTIKLAKVLGIGGESIILSYRTKQKSSLAVKFVPFTKKVQGVLGFLDPKYLHREEQSAEIIPAQLDHLNIIKYHQNLFQVIDDKLFHITIMDQYDAVFRWVYPGIHFCKILRL